jgi:hypothetical protein
LLLDRLLLLLFRALLLNRLRLRFLSLGRRLLLLNRLDFNLIVVYVLVSDLNLVISNAPLPVNYKLISVNPWARKQELEHEFLVSTLLHLNLIPVKPRASN